MNNETDRKHIMAKFFADIYVIRLPSRYGHFTYLAIFIYFNLLLFNGDGPIPFIINRTNIDLIIYVYPLFLPSLLVNVVLIMWCSISMFAAVLVCFMCLCKLWSCLVPFYRCVFIKCSHATMRCSLRVVMPQCGVH